MKDRIHKFEQNGTYILLDINSGAVHVIDKMIYDMMDTFDGTNDDEVLKTLDGKYPKEDLTEALEELHELMKMHLRRDGYCKIPLPHDCAGLQPPLQILLRRRRQLRTGARCYVAGNG